MIDVVSELTQAHKIAADVEITIFVAEWPQACNQDLESTPGHRRWPVDSWYDGDRRSLFLFRLDPFHS